MVGSFLTVGRLSDSSFTRDVVINGRHPVVTPGGLDFEVVAPLTEGVSKSMTVAVLVDSGTSVFPSCRLQSREGSKIAMTLASSQSLYVSLTRPSSVPVAVARLNPGKYRIDCDASVGSDRGASRNHPSFTVGRVVGPGDLRGGELSPLLWFAGVIVVTGLLFVSGALTLTVGLVRRSRTKRSGVRS